MKNIILSLSILALLAGCATTENYEKILGTWVGSSEQQLIQSWGPPSSVYESGGQKYLTYTKSRSGYIPGTSPTYQTQIIGNTAYTTSSGGSPGFAYTKSCKTTFTIQGTRISGWRYEGNNCVALAPEDNGVTTQSTRRVRCAKAGDIRTLNSEGQCTSWGGTVVR